MKKTLQPGAAVPLIDRFGGGRALIQNKGPGKLYIDSDAAVTVSTGIEIAVGGVFEQPEDSNSGTQIYGAVDAADTDVRIAML